MTTIGDLIASLDDVLLIDAGYSKQDFADLLSERLGVGTGWRIVPPAPAFRYLHPLTNPSPREVPLSEAELLAAMAGGFPLSGGTIATLADRQISVTMAAIKKAVKAGTIVEVETEVPRGFGLVDAIWRYRTATKETTT